MSNVRVPYQGYWERRKGMNYYRTAKALIESYSAGGKILDVGSATTPVATWGHFRERTAINLQKLLPDQLLPGVQYWFGDFIDYPADQTFNVVSCLQVLEHLPDPVVFRFTTKLFVHAISNVIISVPLNWPAKEGSHHLQDPVTREKLHSWTGRIPIEEEIDVDGGVKRITCVYRV